jgi:hypothetical protein
LCNIIMRYLCKELNKAEDKEHELKRV